MMRSGFRLGRMFGIEITIDWSWIIIFLLVSWQLAAALFPSVHPNWQPALCWMVAIAAALLFFASVLAHELAHSLAAKARGMEVRNITLFLFGGVSNIQREPPSAEAEFVITIVGPLTSFVLGFIFLVLGGVTMSEAGNLVGSSTQIFARLSPLTTLLFWLGQINILVALFNLIPAFPLDGGRVLRSLIWAATNNLRSATRTAAWIGQMIAWVMIFCGIWMVFGAQFPLLGGGLLGGLWLMFIGWFLNAAAIASYQQVVIGDVLQGVPVANLMRTGAPAAPPHIPVSSLVSDYLLRGDEEAFPVTEGDHLEGLVSIDDVRNVPQDAWTRTEVNDIMTPADRLEAVAPRTASSEAMLKMARSNLRAIPVVDNGHLVGMLRLRDVVRWLQLHSDGLPAGGQ
jgi:Zn-dependent protease/CBS domain-containing protein